MRKIQIQTFLLSALSILGVGLVCVWPARAISLVDENFNPIKGGRIVIVSKGDTLEFDCTSGTCVPAGGDTLKILGSTSGLAHDGANGVKVWLYRSGTTAFDGGESEGFTIGGAPEFWLNGACGPDGNPCGTGGLEFVNSRGDVVAGDQDVTAVQIPYLQATINATSPSYTITMMPTFGGSGPIRGTIKVGHKVEGCTECPHNHTCSEGSAVFDTYRDVIIEGLFGRSTDIDGDGDTDEADVDSVKASVAGGPARPERDLDWSGSVTTADLDIAVTEARRRNAGAPWTGGTVGDDGSTGDAINAYNAANSSTRLMMTPPATITSLSVTRLDASTVRLSWTAPADDGSTGSPATAYDVRTASSLITTVGQFDAATSLSSPPTPGTPGATQTMDVSLAQGTCAYFCVRAKDDVDNWSAVGNSPTESTVPGAVFDLLVATGRYMAKLTWTAPGDDGYCGTATEYSIRYVTGGTISESNWSSATEVSSPPAPAASGTGQCLVAPDLSSCTSYSFALKSRDAGGQWSPLSNVKTVMTKCSGNPTVDCGSYVLYPGTEEETPESQWTLSLGRFQPNPARSAGHLNYVIPTKDEGSELDLGVFDVAGRRIAVLQRGSAVAGPHIVEWDLKSTDGRRVQAGAYFLRLRLGTTQLRQVILVAP